MIAVYQYVKRVYSVDTPYIMLGETCSNDHEFKLKTEWVAKDIRLNFSLQINNIQ